MTLFLIAASFIFLGLAIIWSSTNFLNLAIKLCLCGMLVWSGVLLLDLHYPALTNPVNLPVSK